ncbi:MAG: hypothetical protein A3B25_00400 [Candidatus Ryanbacteria bacterium RIFCSPLOWO2_01_FULL_48_26]|uniref:Uncharacterized protein n=1 Tax=Candidatus Ryanbacteria bacterium RIFCSPLOWO2_01_FULL_48_26 TaxID=1802126 RepID=A0A1G2GR29_9BACT|nr:MAG: hypothetical protein A3B25_00400 [Candidatus Ryanbacteria bacterium RIFCSPLOWO2_01_FULL_48_26]
MTNEYDEKQEGDGSAENPARVKRPFLGVIIIIAIFGVVLFFFGGIGSRDFPAPASKWQAVFLSNNQVYFGHLKDYTKTNVALTDIFYLRVTESLQPGSLSQPSPELVKLGGELHGPEDAMYIPKDKILFWENLRADSPVVRAIASSTQQK